MPMGGKGAPHPGMRPHLHGRVLACTQAILGAPPIRCKNTPRRAHPTSPPPCARPRPCTCNPPRLFHRCTPLLGGSYRTPSPPLLHPCPRTWTPHYRCVHTPPASGEGTTLLPALTSIGASSPSYLRTRLPSAAYCLQGSGGTAAFGRGGAGGCDGRQGAAYVSSSELRGASCSRGRQVTVRGQQQSQATRTRCCPGGCLAPARGRPGLVRWRLAPRCRWVGSSARRHGGAGWSAQTPPRAGRAWHWARGEGRQRDVGVAQGPGGRRRQRRWGGCRAHLAVRMALAAASPPGPPPMMATSRSGGCQGGRRQGRKRVAGRRRRTAAGGDGLSQPAAARARVIPEASSLLWRAPHSASESPAARLGTARCDVFGRPRSRVLARRPAPCCLIDGTDRAPCLEGAPRPWLCLRDPRHRRRRHPFTRPVGRTSWQICPTTLPPCLQPAGDLRVQPRLPSHR